MWMILGFNSFQDHNFKTFTNLEHVCLLFLSLGDYLKSLHFGSTSLFSDLLSHFSTKDMCTHTYMNIQTNIHICELTQQTSLRI